ncbi:dolichyl-phosphate-mannose--protein mannosyltransferase [Zhihengliuella halotolerans]|uniref:dolichyl-phosphate-mannose--protein mannosyltransferase n=1 Tax=Zhihengliuella halotolerans TaxID=370736 RepID=UPI002155A3E3|nr:phospholipid carrier-dependent glycosyltransferase [Zhihengliuella halotolerans]
MTRWIQSPEAATSRTALRERLLGRTAPSWSAVPSAAPLARAAAFATRHAFWLVPALITALAAWLRLVNLSAPHDLIFDETYYVKDAFTLLQSGYERQWPDEGADEAFLAGNPQPLEERSYVVHPPLGKWLIGLGMLAFGADNGLGWRFAPAVAGTLSVLLVYLVGRKLLGSILLGGIAALLTAVDGHHLVMSRTALLDVFTMLFCLAAFYVLLLDRDDGRRRLAAKVAAATDHGRRAGQLLYGPWNAWRPWRILAGVLLGAAVGTKWSALAFVAVFGLMTVLWDVGARRAAGIRHWGVSGLLRDGIPAFFTMIPAAAVTYLATWTGWLRTAGGYHRQWAEKNPEQAWPLVPDALRSLAEYHRSAYGFHRGLGSDHSWESGPETWLFAGRPVLYHYDSPTAAEGCAFETCSRVVTDLPNPLIWWSAALALLVVVFYWAGARDWRAGAILAGIAAGFVPWWFYPERTMFFFYTISFHPFMMLALAYVLGLALGPARAAGPPLLPGTPTGPPLGRLPAVAEASPHDDAATAEAAERRRAGIAVVGVFMALAIALSAFFWPVWTGQTISYEAWHLRVWLPSWG